MLSARRTGGAAGTTMATPFLDRSTRKIDAADDRRETSRMKSYAEAWADPGGMDPAVPCRIIDISRTGAKIECAATLPDEFMLHVGANKFVGQVVWRRQQLLGVEFRLASKALKSTLPARK
ncbi:MAG: hypothetical protein CTY15_05745 [Methylocystis sp.]|nr:MAG: hypothetical protein CTY15_05745 [Methylocystis sp.]